MPMLDESGYIRVNEVFVTEDRQRQHFDEKELEDLALSIRLHGLINPIVITTEGQLVAGERRLRAHKILGYENIAFRRVDTLDPLELAAIELEENIRRANLTWQEEVKAIAAYHVAKASRVEDWSHEKTGEELNLSRTKVSQAILVARNIEEGVEEVINSPKLSSAISFATRRAERKQAAAAREVGNIAAAVATKIATKSDAPVMTAEELQELKSPKKRFAELQEADFLEWVKEERADKFNLIHCDFPYGVNATKLGQSSAKALGGYEDEADTYKDLLEAFVAYQDNFVFDNAHLMFWFSMDYYQMTKDIFTAAGWTVNPFPLVWTKSDNRGILPDAQRGPRRIYETAFLASRGDRKVVRPVSNAYHGATTKQFHMSEKPHAVLTHFLRMLVDETTTLLDPTCGSGMAVKVAEELGASYSLGLDKSADYIERERTNLDLFE